jgi:hypothetical protein
MIQFFWNNLAKDSTAYFTNNVPFPKEDEKYNIILLFSFGSVFFLN